MDLRHSRKDDVIIASTCTMVAFGKCSKCDETRLAELSMHVVN
jgi:hypothetical protein